MVGGLPSYVQAAERIAARAAELRIQAGSSERIDLLHATGRVLAVAVNADREMPAFPKSTRDGFACRAAELTSGALLPVAGSIRAGQAPAQALPPSSAWEIMTGAAVPAGADAVVMLEHVLHEDGGIRLAAGRRISTDENIVPAGAEARAGAEIIPAGVRLAAAQIAAAATCGYAQIDVFRRPTVAILTTGDELVELNQQPGPSQIRNSNAAMLASLVERSGGQPWILPAARDTADSLASAIQTALAADMLLISGGVSAGKFDLVEPSLETFGAKFHFTGVRIQPGKPLVFGELPGTKPFFGLPGNPISSAATFLLFAAPILAALSGSTETSPRFVTARLGREIKGKPDLTRFVPADCPFQALSGAPPSVAAVNWQGSGDLAAFARANCFLAVPEGVPSIAVGEEVRILPF